MLLKKVKVNNPMNMLVQMPRFITNEFWRLKKDDVLEVRYDESTGSIIIRPKEASLGGDADDQGKRVSGSPA